MSLSKKAIKETNWSKTGWRQLPIKQQPQYADQQHVQQVEERLAKVPSLIFPEEAVTLKKELAKVANGEAFLLQGGDCAESFAEFSEQNLKDYFRIILQMTVALMYGTGKPIVKVGRIAGQFAKPRSSDLEVIEGKSLPSYRGDMVNSIDYDDSSR